MTTMTERFKQLAADEKILALTKERDEYQQAADTQAAAHKVERDELMAAAKLALDALQRLYKDFPYINQINGGMQAEEAIAALKKAGV